MRLSILPVSAFGAVLALSSPASAAWQGYISHTLGFAFAAPGDLKPGKTTYKAAIAGTRDAMTWTSVDDGIEYKAVVIDMTSMANQSSTLLGEAEYVFQDRQKLMMDTFGRVDRHYGRKLTIDLPGGARKIACFYFINGRIVSLQASVPAGGDTDNPELARFVDSITFYPERAADDDKELPMPQ